MRRRLTTGDVMNPDVLTVPTDRALRELVRLLGREMISGVSVVDEHDRVVGVVSQADLARTVADRPPRRAAAATLLVA